jgi:GT2 family glycosyltransferase
MLRPENADVGICGVQLVDAAGNVQRSCARFPDAKTYLAQAFGFAGVSPSRFSHIMMTFDHQETRDVDHVMGAYLLIRRSLFEELGAFDERFFVYLEDLDLALRAKRLGWRIVFLAQARAYHKGGGVSDQVKEHRLFYSLRSRILYAFKHFDRAEAWAVCLATLAIEPIPRLMRGLLRFSGRELIDTLHGFALLWWGIPSMLQRAFRR